MAQNGRIFPSGLSLVQHLAKLDKHSSHDIAEYLASTVNLRDIEKAIYHYEIAAMGGNEIARFWLGIDNVGLTLIFLCFSVCPNPLLYYFLPSIELAVTQTIHHIATFITIN